MLPLLDIEEIKLSHVSVSSRIYAETGRQLISYLLAYAPRLLFLSCCSYIKCHLFVIRKILCFKFTGSKTQVHKIQKKLF